MLRRLALTSLLIATTARAAPEIQPLGECGPIARRHDHVAIRGERLGRLGGTPLDHVAVLAMRDGRSVPIPFQLDESRGRKPTLTGPGARVDQRPGRIDFDDVVLFLPCHAGTRATPEDRAVWASRLGVTQWREIEIDDPLTGAAAWGYVVVAPSPPRDSSRFVDYLDTDLVATTTYRIGMAGALPVFFAMVTDGQPTQNLLDGLRLRAEGVLRGGLADVAITERDARHELTASGAGPIRVVRRSEHFVNVALGIELGVGTAHTYFYPLRITGPGRMSLPFSPSVLFRDISASGGVDLTELDGWTFEAAGIDPPFAVDGTPAPAERSLRRRGYWFVLRKGPVAIFTVMRTSPNLARVAPLDLLYVDDLIAAVPGERVPGHMPLVGFQARGLERLPAGRYEFTFDVLFDTDWEPGRERTLLQQVETPLGVRLSARSDREDAPASRP